MYNLKVYLAGKMSGLSFEKMNEWRQTLKARLEATARNAGYKVTVINPVSYYNFENKRHQSEREVEEFDLSHAASSDIVVVNLDGLASSDGAKYEIYEAYRHHRIPVIAFGDKVLYDNLHPWVKSKITRVEKDMQDVCSYIAYFYMRR